LTDQVVPLIEDDSANLLARITAVQLSGQLGIQESREAVRGIATNPSVPPTLRIAGLAALARLGKEQDVAILEQTITSGDDRLQLGAASALKRLKEAGEDQRISSRSR
jgi:HEAT repeat protein